MDRDYHTYGSMTTIRMKHDYHKTKAVLCMFTAVSSENSQGPLIDGLEQ